MTMVFENLTGFDLAVALASDFATKAKQTPDITQAFARMKEEVAEVRELISDKSNISDSKFVEHFLKEIGDSCYTMGYFIHVVDGIFSKGLTTDVIKFVDQFLDTLDEADQITHTICEWADGLEQVVGRNVVDDVLRTIHKSNLSKLDPLTGEATFDENGKIQKGAHYVEPDLSLPALLTVLAFAQKKADA